MAGIDGIGMLVLDGVGTTGVGTIHFGVLHIIMPGVGMDTMETHTGIMAITEEVLPTMLEEEVLI